MVFHSEREIWLIFQSYYVKVTGEIFSGFYLCFRKKIYGQIGWECGVGELVESYLFSLNLVLSSFYILFFGKDSSAYREIMLYFAAEAPVKTLFVRIMPTFSISL